MAKIFLAFITFCAFVCCTDKNTSEHSVIDSPKEKVNHINKIPLPKGFERIVTDSNSFEFFLQHIALKKDNTVYFFDGTKKPNQHSHYAVLDVSVPKEDLQQCADAIMRLRAEYFFRRKEYNKIEFKSANTTYNFANFLRYVDVDTYEKGFAAFMKTVFQNCGTYNLADMLQTQKNVNDLGVGEVFVKGGSPGHAMIVVDCAINKLTHEKIFLLAQSYMPAQSIHIVVNPNDKQLSPWYKVEKEKELITPGYTFDWTHLKSW